MSELVEDPQYLAYLKVKPSMPAHLADPGMMATPPWVVYVQIKEGGKWGKKSFWKYKKALKFLMKCLGQGVYDAALNNKRIGYEPPKKIVRVRGKYKTHPRTGVKTQVTAIVWWKPAVLGVEEHHNWCMHCRRPTLFKYLSRHRVLGEVTSTVPRCCICGASARIAIHGPSDHGFRVH